MYSDLELCEKIISFYPEIGECGIDIDVDYDQSKNTWVVHLQKDTHSLDHFLEVLDADRCMDGKQCVALGLEIAQLRKNIKGEQF
jgi:hypothetical protein